MKNRLTFNTLKIEGFATIKDYKTFKLNNPGLHIIRGLNGSGKTTIFSALTWALYGKGLKQGQVPTWEHLRDPGWSGTMVSVSFYRNNIKTKITRCKDYTRKIGTIKGGNRLVVEEEGVPIDLKDKRDIQRYIEDLLGMSYDLFVSSVIFVQNGQRFIKEPGPKKKAILEESFKIDWVTKAADIGKKELSALERPLLLSEAGANKTISSIESLKRILKGMEESKKEFEQNKQREIRKIEEELKVLNTNIDFLDISKWVKEENEVATKVNAISNKILDFKDNYPTLDQDIKKKERLETTLFSKIQDGKRKVKGIDVKTEAHCPTCGQAITKLNAKSICNKIMDSVNNWEKERVLIVKDLGRLNKLQQKLLDLRDQKSELEIELREKTENLAKARNKNSSIEFNRGRLSELTKKLKETKAKNYIDKSDSIKKELEKLEEELKTKEVKLNSIRRKVKMLRWAIKDPLSNTGIKAFLFNSLLDSLNKRLSYYSKFVGLGVELVIDMGSAYKKVEAIITKDGVPVSYNDLSGGEEQMVDALISLGAGDVLLQDNPVNIRVYDEITTYLDPPSIEIIGTLLTDIAKDHSIFVITHHDQLNVLGASEIKVEKTE